MFHFRDTLRKRGLIAAALGAVAVGLCVLGMLHAEQPSRKLAAPIDKGQHVLIMGNSFQVFVDHHLNVMAGAAGIKGHVRGGDPLAATGRCQGRCGRGQSLVQDS